MLRGIELINFMAFAHESVTDLDQYPTIAVIGENGHGKSAFLESIYYALYGEGRTKVLGDLVRDGKDEMEVALHLLDKKNVPVTIQRGISKGKGWAKYFVGEELKAQGQAVEKIVRGELLGTDAATFLLTRFFGLGANDTLMKVRPSDRLETMQTIANIDVYSSSLHPAVVNRRATVSGKVGESKGALYAMEKDAKSPAAIRSELAKAQASLVFRQKEVRELQNKQADISAKLDQLTAFNTEKASLRTALRELGKRSDDATSVLARLQEDAKDTLKAGELVGKSIAKAEAEIAAFGKEDTLEEKRRKFGDIVAECHSAISLRETALKDPHDANCPLCGNDLGDLDSVTEKWTAEIEKYRKKQSEADEARAKAEQSLRALRAKQKELDTLKEEQRGLLKEQKSSATPLEKAFLDCQRASSALMKAEQRMTLINKKAKELEQAFPEAEGLDKKISLELNEIGRLEANIEIYGKQVREAEAQHKAILAEKRVIRNMLLDQDAIALVEKAFSRYGIPIGLLQGLCGAIEEEATVIYNAFDSGQIEVSDIEDRGKPGIDFFLVNRTGRRSYEQLSEGQKVMVFLSVRLALSKIISTASGIKSDFLVLDEVTSHLSPKRRDDLMQLIIDVLGRSFAQVFVVSHAEIRDIFSANIFVEMNDAVSTLSIL
jgi:DNA repair exonuclease SbcCD ATPase subunit